MPSVIFNLSNPRAANGQSYVDAYLGNGRTVLWDYTGTAISNATVTAVRFKFYGNVLRSSGTANVTMNGSPFSIDLTATGETRQNCTCYASGAVMAAFAAASGTLTMALVMPSNAYFRTSAATATLEVDYTINITKTTPPTTFIPANSVGEGNVVLSWSGAGAGVQNTITGYEIQCAGSADNVTYGDWSACGSVASTSAMASASVPVNSTRGAWRKYRIRTMGSAGESWYSDWKVSSAVRTNTRPNAPTGLIVSPLIYESGTIDLRWTAATDETDSVQGYRIMAATSSDGKTWSAYTLADTVTTCKASLSPSLSRGVYIRYGLYAVDSFGVLSENLAVFADVVRNRVPNVPSNIQATPAIYESGNVAIRWTASEDPDGQAVTYQVMRQTSTDGNVWSDAVSIASGLTEAACTDSPTLSRGAFVRYLVAAADDLDALSAQGVSNVVQKNRLPSAPTAVEASPTLYESGGITLTWPECTEPDGNLAGYQIQQQLSADGATWGAWTDAGTVSTNAATVSPAVNRGQYVRFRVCAADALQAVSAWTESSVIRRNRVPDTPQIICGGELDRVATSPVFAVTAGEEPDGESMRVQYMLEAQNGAQELAWTDAGILSSAGGTLAFRANAGLETGTHRLLVRLVDTSGGVSDSASSLFTVAEIAWAREIAAGDVIADEDISHRADITELLKQVNLCRKRAGLVEITLPGTVGAFADWQKQMTALMDGVNACSAAVKETGTTQRAAAPTVTAYPSAAVVNSIRELCEGV